MPQIILLMKWLQKLNSQKKRQQQKVIGAPIQIFAEKGLIAFWKFIDQATELDEVIYFFMRGLCN